MNVMSNICCCWGPQFGVYCFDQILYENLQLGSWLNGLFDKIKKNFMCKRQFEKSSSWKNRRQQETLVHSHILCKLRSSPTVFIHWISLLSLYSFFSHSRFIPMYMQYYEKKNNTCTWRDVNFLKSYFSLYPSFLFCSLNQFLQARLLHLTIRPI